MFSTLKKPSCLFSSHKVNTSLFGLQCQQDIKQVLSGQDRGQAFVTSEPHPMCAFVFTGHPHAIQNRKVPVSATERPALLSNTEPGSDLKWQSAGRHHAPLYLTWLPFLHFKTAHHQHWPSFNRYISQFIKIWDNSQWVLLGPKVRATLGHDGGGATHHKLLQGKRLCYRQTTGHASGTAVVTWFHWASTNISKATWIFLLIFTVVK